MAEYEVIEDNEDDELKVIETTEQKSVTTCSTPGCCKENISGIHSQIDILVSEHNDRIDKLTDMVDSLELDVDIPNKLQVEEIE